MISSPDYGSWRDRCIIKLGTAGTLSGFDIDTTHFNGEPGLFRSCGCFVVVLMASRSGNEAPRASVEALLSSEDPNAEDSRVNSAKPCPRTSLIICSRSSCLLHLGVGYAVDRDLTQSRPGTVFEAPIQDPRICTRELRQTKHISRRRRRELFTSPGAICIPRSRRNGLIS
jgi:hypothetical protein